MISALPPALAISTEARFENAFYGSGAAFKTDALTKILQMAA